MAEKPILFNTPMVQAILDLRKRMTRRPIDWDISNCFDVDTDGSVCAYLNPATGDSYKPEEICRYKVGDILYVRETWCKNGETYLHKAGCPHLQDNMYIKWKPSIHMPREAARIFLRVTGVRVERVQEITGRDVLAEGVARLIGDLDTELCDNCPLPDELKDVRCYGGNPAMCEGSHCGEAYERYLSEAAIDEFADLWDSIYANRGYGWEQNPWVEVTELERVVNNEKQTG